MISPAGFLMIEPSRPASAAPVIDAVTRKVTAIWRHGVWTSETMRYRGWHTCICGAASDNRMHRLGDVKGPETNSLIVHYVAYHRDEIPAGELAKIQEIAIDGEQPTPKELGQPQAPPDPGNTRVRGMRGAP